MKHFLLFIILESLFVINGYSQYIETDSMNLGEDRSSHGYVEFNPSGGGSIRVGVYSCDGDSAIVLGANNQNDSIVFYLNVTPNTDEIQISWNYSWYNAGSSKDQWPAVVIENKFEDSLIAAGPNAIGSDPTNCDMSLHKLSFTGMSNYTSDGQIKVKIYDPYPGFEGNSSICRFKIYSAGTNNLDARYSFKEIKAYPNPCTSSFMIESKSFGETDINIQLIDVLGNVHKVLTTRTDKNITVSTADLSNGIYFVKIAKRDTGEILWYHKLFKE